MIKFLLLAVLNAMLFVNAEMTCHYEALPVNSTDCPDYPNEAADYPDEEFGSADYDGVNQTPECPLDPQNAIILFDAGTLICEADMKLHMETYADLFASAKWGSSDPFVPNPLYGNITDPAYTGWDTRPEGTDLHENNCNMAFDMYWIRCEEVTAVGGEDCKPLDEAGCAAQPDSCRATSRSGKFRKCKPKRCKPMTESECEAAVHCEKKFGRRGDYKRCRRIDSSRA